MLKMKQAIQRWYEGTYVPHENQPHSSLQFMGGYQKRHWTARCARAVIDFCMSEWKWVIGTIIAVAGMIIAIKKLHS